MMTCMLHVLRRQCRAVGLLASFILAGCASVERPPLDRATLLSDGLLLRQRHERMVDSTIERLARRMVRRGDGTVDILLLSGGGQNGAYGAGFIRAWAQDTRRPMPTFDLVTGVSTGALQSPLAFLASPADLDTLVALYEHAVESVAPSIDWFFWLHPNGGVVDVERFTATIRRTVDTALVRRLLDAFAADRQLIVNTVDIDLAIGRSWNITDELGPAGEHRERVHDILQASSAIPGIFPPVLLDNHVHVDGGVVSNVGMVLGLDDYRTLSERCRSLGVRGPLRVRLWTIMNIWSHVRPAVTDIASRGEMAQRGNQLLFMAQQPQIVERLQLLGDAVRATVPDMTVEVRTTMIPDTLVEDPGAAKLFDEGFMLRLLAIGAERARSDTPWEQVMPSPFLRPARGEGSGW